MEIAFRTKALRAMCLDSDALDEKLGAEGGATMRQFLADVQAAECLAEVPLLAIPHTENRWPNLAVFDLGSDVIVEVRANHRQPPLTSEGAVNWLALDRLLIQKVGVKHA